MAISTAITAILEGNASLVAIMGTRIYPDVLPQKYSLPAVSYTVTNIQPQDYKQGTAGWTEVYINVNVFANNRTECEAYAGYVRSALTRVTGAFGGETLQTGNNQGESWSYDLDMTQPGTAKMGQGVYIHELSFKLVMK